jgi:hypothetical protein
LLHFSFAVNMIVGFIPQSNEWFIQRGLNAL